MVFLTFPLLAIEIGSVPGPEEIKAAQENFINVYQAVTDQAIAFDHLRKHELQKHISDCIYFRLVTNNGREIPFLVRDNSHYNTIAGLRHLKRQLLACAFAAIDSDTKNQLFLAYQRLSAGIKELDFALQNYYGHLHLKDTP